MRSPSVTTELPSGCEVVGGRRGILAVRSEYAEALRAARFGPDGDEGLTTSDLRGRRSLEEFTHADARFLVRRYHHGGLLRFLTGARFLDSERPFRELSLSEFLTSRDIATPLVVAARAVRGVGGGWKLTLVSRRIEGVVDLAAVLEEVRGGAVPFRSRAQLTQALGELVGRLHEVGFLHADLHPKNVLVERGERGPRLWIIDLDGSERRASLTDDERRDNLRRLLRSLLRPRGDRAPVLTRGDARRFLARYLVAAERDPTTWREEWHAIRRRADHRSLFHRLGWFLERRFGSPP